MHVLVNLHLLKVLEKLLTKKKKNSTKKKKLAHSAI